MPTEKPLPDADDDIIDLTDLVEEGSAGGASSDEPSPADMSFEQELDDLFADAEPVPGPSTAKDAPVGDDELIDLEGMDLAEETPEPAASTPPPAKPDADDDLMDLSGLDFEATDEPAAEPTASTPPPAKPDADDDLMDLSGLDFEATDEPAAEPAASTPPPAKPDDDLMDLSDLSFDDAALDEPAPAPTNEATEQKPSIDVEPTPEAVVPETPPPAEEAVDLKDISFPDLELPPEKPLDTSAMDALLGDLPEESTPQPKSEEPPHISELADLPSLEEPAQPPVPAASAMAAPESAPQTAPLREPAPARGASTPPIDLDALDQLIKTAKGPEPEPEPVAGVAVEALDALSARLEALEAATASLTSQIEMLSRTPDADMLAASLSDRLEASLTGRLEALRDEISPQTAVAGPDSTVVEGLRTELLAAIDNARPDTTALIDELRVALFPDFDALRQDLPRSETWIGKEEMAQAVVAGRDEVMARLDAVLPERQALLQDFNASLESRLTALREDLPTPDALVSPETLAQALEAFRQSINADMAATLDARFNDILDAAKQVARDEARSIRDELIARLDSLEADHVAPEALAEQVRQNLLPSLPDSDVAMKTATEALAGLAERVTTGDFQAAMKSLRADIADEILHSVPKAAAAVIREEIAALVKDFGEQP